MEIPDQGVRVAGYQWDRNMTTRDIHPALPQITRFKIIQIRPAVHISLGMAIEKSPYFLILPRRARLIVSRPFTGLLRYSSQELVIGPIHPILTSFKVKLTHTGVF